MADYIITGAAPTLYVEQDRGADGIFCNGPYKNEESAKRRIRKLKSNDEAAQHCEQPSDNIIPQDAVSPEDRAFINAGRFVDDVRNLAADIEAENGPLIGEADEAMEAIMAAKAETEYSPSQFTGTGFDEGSCYDTYSEDEAYRFDSSIPRGQAAFRRNMMTPTGAFVTQDYSEQPRNGYRPAHRANRLRGTRVAVRCQRVTH